MTSEEIKEQTTAVFRKVFADTNLEIHDAMTAKDVERWDSLNHHTLISTVEEQFGIKFKLKEVIGMKNVGDLLRLIEAKKN
ncbi:MAG: acyl carrier protein [Bacteroidetes bacterium]|nr:MAG: acyl carrier protein [Bacteroidota bacterium]